MSDAHPDLGAAAAADDTGRMGTCVGALVAAIQFMTRIPISSSLPTTEMLRRSPLFFPLVGLGIGGFTAGVLGLAGLVWPAWIAVLLALAAELRLTGALHEDGLADFCDAFGGGWSEDQILSILKDSRIGTYGTLGLGLGVALRATCLVVVVTRFGQQDWSYWAAALVASAAVGRWMIVLAMVLVPPMAQRRSLTRDVGRQMSWSGFLLSGLGALPGIVWFSYLMPTQAFLAGGLTAVAMLILLRLILRKLGGVTGDCLGCIGYVSQLLLLLAATARLP